MISKSFLKSSLIFTAGGALPMVASIVLLPFYTNRLSDVLYTQVLFYISITAFSQIVFSVATDSYFGIRYSQLYKDDEGRRRFITTVSRLLLLTGTGILILSALAGNWIFRHFFTRELGMSFWPFGFFSVLTGFFNAYYKTASIALIYLEKPGHFLTSSILNFVATVGISAGGLILIPDSIEGPLYGRLLSGALVALYGWWVFAKHGHGKPDRSFMPELLRFCLPYLVFALCGWVLTQVDRYILESRIEFTALNAYDLVLKCFIGVEFIQNSLSAVIFPKIYEIWARDGQSRTTPESNRYFNVFTAVNIVQILGFSIILPFLYQWLVHKESFYAGEKYIPIIAAGYGLRSIVNFYIAPILYSKKMGTMLSIALISAAFQVASNWIACVYWGVAGALYSGLMTRVLQAGLYMYFTRHFFEFDFNWNKIIVIPVVFLVINALGYYILDGFSMMFMLIELGGFSVLFFLIFRTEITKVMQSYGLIKST